VRDKISLSFVNNVLIRSLVFNKVKKILPTAGEQVQQLFYDDFADKRKILPYG